jgi:hypothetical protein
VNAVVAETDASLVAGGGALGAPHQWSPTLRVMVRFVLANRFLIRAQYSLTPAKSNSVEKSRS